MDLPKVFCLVTSTVMGNEEEHQEEVKESKEDHDDDDDNSDTEDEDEEEEAEIWKKHYSSKQRILLVGEGDLSFSLCLARAFGSARNIVATSLDTQGTLKKTFLDILWNGFWIKSHFMWVLITTFYFCCCAWWWWWWSEDIARKYSNGIGNVRELEERGCLVLYKVDAKQMSQHYFLKTQRFDRIVYNLPHVGFLYRESSYCQIQLCYVSLIFLFYSPLSLFYFILFFFHILFP